MQVQTPGVAPYMNMADHAIDRWGPVGAVIVGACIFAAVFVWRVIAPFVIKRIEEREKFHRDLVSQNLAQVDTLVKEYPAALDRITSAFQRWGERTERKIDDLPDEVEQRFIRVMKNHSGK